MDETLALEALLEPHGFNDSDFKLWKCGMSYLYAAYIATWAIHIGYLTILLRRYTRLRNEIAELKERTDLQKLK